MQKLSFSIIGLVFCAAAIALGATGSLPASAALADKPPVAPITPAQPRPLPAKVDLTPLFTQDGLAPENQGDRADCTLFAITGLADFETARHGGAQKHLRLAPEFLIWAARKATGHKGDQSMFYEAIHGLNILGICTENLMPYVGKPDPKRTPTEKAIADARTLAARWKPHWIKRWDLTRHLTDAEFHAIKEALAAGHPVACGLRWPKELKGSSIVAVPPAGQVEDGHSIVFVGYEDDLKKPGGGMLRFRNSWGPKWGEDGYGLMSYGYARAYANDAVWLELEPPRAEVPLRRFEAFACPVLARGKCETNEQKMADWGPLMWSQGKQLFCDAKDGGFVELALDVKKPGRYRMRVLATAAPDYGIVRFALDGKRQGPDVDLYSGRVCPSGTLELGTHDLAAGRHRIHISAIGKNPSSKNFFFGIDAIDLLPPN